MSKTANPTLVGTFVIVAIGLVLGTVILLGSFNLQDKVIKSVLYFSGSLHGLDVGAPVTLRGVTVGRVTSIQIDFDRRQNNYTIPVNICIERQDKDGEEMEEWDQEAVERTMLQMIKKGLKAKLKLRSLITGKLYIDLDFYPDAAPVFLHNKSDMIEIPTLPSGLDQFTQVITDLPLQEIAQKINTVLDSINHLMNSEQSKETLTALNTSLIQAELLMGDTRKLLPQLKTDVKLALQAIIDFSESGSTLFQSTDTNLTPVLSGMQETLINIDLAAAKLTLTLENVGALVDEDSNFSYAFSTTLREIQLAAQSIKQLANELHRRPESLIFGRRESTTR